MKKEWGILVVVLAALPAATPSIAHETDNFTPPSGTPLADVELDLMRLFHQRLSNLVEELNDQRAKAIERGYSREKIDQMQRPELLAQRCRNQWLITPLVIDRLELKLREKTWLVRHPGQPTALRRINWIYTFGHLPVDPRQLILALHASTIRIGDSYQGTDKYGHFIIKGIWHYRRYLKLRDDDVPHQEALGRLGAFSTSWNLLESERGLFGGVTTGVWSNADLAADYLGALFMINLTETVRVNGADRPPILVLDGDTWRLNDHVRPDGKLVRWYFNSPHLDEALNPSCLIPAFREITISAIQDRADGFLAWRTNANGLRPSAGTLRSIYQRIATLDGVDYGRSELNGRIISTSDVCWPDQPLSIDEPMARNTRGEPALHVAARRGDMSTLKAALEAGVSVDASNQSLEHVSSDWGQTALASAVQDGQTQTAQALIAAGAKLNATDAQGRTALHCTVPFRMPSPSRCS